jgi:transposase InsO family protein
MNDTVEKVRSREGKPQKHYTFALKLRAVKLHLEEGLQCDIISKELEVGASTIHGWCRRYREYGERGLQPQYERGPKAIPEGLRNEVLRLKTSEPGFGIKRISQTLRRMFFIRADKGKVRRILKDAGIAPNPSNGSGKRNVRKPRFFERSTPNQMWQSDICMFKLGGKNAYLIGFIDDYSRFITGLELYMSQSSCNVMEIYRRSVAEYKPPREMLTDNGRQYASWRGVTDFERELKKDGIKHIKSRPHHPMTLGKIERFWKTIFQEFLLRAQFESFEEARERIRLWVKYYNHRRPHQGIGGLCPADRYFEVDGAVRKVIEQGIADNTLELALRGKPKDPFYMVGRMNGQSVMLTVEKGKLKLSVDGKEGLAYETGIKDGKGSEKKFGGIRTEVENGSGFISVDGVEKSGAGVQGDGDKMGDSVALGEPGVIGDSSGLGAEKERDERSGLTASLAEASFKEREDGEPEDDGESSAVTA